MFNLSSNCKNTIWTHKDSRNHNGMEAETHAILSCHLLALPFLLKLLVSTEDNTFSGGLCHTKFLAGRDSAYKGGKLWWLPAVLTKSRKIINSQTIRTGRDFRTHFSREPSNWPPMGNVQPTDRLGLAQQFWANIQIWKFDFKIRFVM